MELHEKPTHMMRGRPSSSPVSTARLMPTATRSCQRHFSSAREKARSTARKGRSGVLPRWLW
ncbi:Uncharacterised protein [Flavonifractor plautii]|uniref:Uncharacterized protein n=1 Tax=Flavonifractor plautii TaxID=292800 RepID=A0A174RH04_FLAPL|nr:Uncharacterised protein [Flavonifractor plautii]